MILCFTASLAQANDLTASITHVDATGFPVIEAMLQVYNDQPIDLTSKDFVVEENISKITEFTLVPQEFKHYLVLAIDRSSSIEPAMPDVKKAAAVLVESLAGEFEIAVVSFGSDIDIDHDFSTDKKSLIAAIGKIRPWGGTALFDALYDSCEELESKADLNDLKTVVCLTDGQDSTPSGKHQLSRRDRQEVSKYALDKNIRVINLGLGNDIDAQFLSGLASETGGWYLQTATSDQLAGLCDKLSKRLKLKKHYRLSYNSPIPATESPRRTLKVALTYNGLTAEGSRQYHTPSRVTALAVAAAELGKTLSLDDLLQHFGIAGPHRSILTGRLRLPATQPVHGLTLATFQGLSSVDCRQLINQAHQVIAEKHQQNFGTRKKFLDEHLNCVDQLLKEFYNKAEAPRIRVPESEKIARFIDFLNIRRQEVELLAKQAYEEYLIEFKTSLAELEYFEKTQIGGEKFNEEFFAINTASRTTALQQLSDRYVEQIAENQQKLREKFATSDEKSAPKDSSPDSSGSHLDISPPELPEIKTLD